MTINTRLNGGFLLEKTYLDCTDAAGNCFILYSADLHYYFLRFRYSGFIFSDENNQIVEQRSVFKSCLVTGSHQLTYSNRHLGITGKWTNVGIPIASLLYKNPTGSVYWSCHHPLARCEIHFRNKSYSGLGYAETITLSIKPWRLPMDALIWGRFTGVDVSVIWIQWTGSHPINKLFLNGKEFNDAKYCENKVFFDEGRSCIQFFKIEIVRQVNLGSHFSAKPWMKLLFSATGILNSIETKYKSLAELTTSEGLIYSGRCIYENVQWAT